MKFDNIKITSKFQELRFVSSQDVIFYAKLTGDNNRIHIDDDYAENTIFGRPICHGMLIAGFISKAIATNLPGEGSIYLKQDIKFLKPVYHNSWVSVEIEVIEIRTDKRIITLETICRVGDEKVIEGVAVIKCI